VPARGLDVPFADASKRRAANGSALSKIFRFVARCLKQTSRMEQSSITQGFREYACLANSGLDHDESAFVKAREILTER
jgi:hypothetical protein